MDFANGSRMADPWAADIYQRAIARGCRHPHAIRILARAWIRIIWRCWQDGVAFDPAHSTKHVSKSQLDIGHSHLGSVSTPITARLNVSTWPAATDQTVEA